MPHGSPPRDPETGKFVSPSDAARLIDNFHGDVDILHGGIHYTVPAADLGGGTVEGGGDNLRVEGENTAVIDADQVLGNDEVYEVWALWIDATLTLHTTATAESFAKFSWQLGPDASPHPPSTDQSAFFGGTDAEVGIVDIAELGSREESSYLSGELVGETSVADSTNGLGAGADYDRVRKLIPFSSLFGAGPLLDADDAIHWVGDFGIDNVTDHAVEAAIHLTSYGVTHEL